MVVPLTYEVYKIFGGVMNNTFLIIAVVVVIWAVLFVIMMSFNKK